MSTCNVNTLLSDGKAFATLDARQQQVAIAQLLCDISAAGGSPGGGGETKIIPDGTDPNGTETALEGIRYDSLGNFWAKTNDVSNDTGWERFITASAPVVAPVMEMRLAASEPLTVARATLPASPEMPAVALPPAHPNRLKRFMSAVKTFLLSFFGFLPLILFLCVLNPLPSKAGFPPPLLYQFCTTNGPTALTNILNSILANKVSTNDSRSLSFSGSNWLTGTLDLEGPLRLTNSVGTSGQFLISAGAGKAPHWTDASSSIPSAFFFQTNSITGGITNGSAGDDIHIAGDLFDNNQTNKRVVSVDNNSIVLGNANGDGPASFANGAATVSVAGVITANGSGLTALNASALGSGTVPDARFPATLPAASGVNLTALNASSLASGTAGTARLGSGSATANTLLHGDSTWSAVAAGDLPATVTTNNGTLSTSLLIGDGGRGVANTAVGAVPIDGNGTATTFAQVNALAQGLIITNRNVNGFTNESKVVFTNTAVVGTNSLHDTNIFQVATPTKRKAFEVDTNGNVFVGGNGFTNANDAKFGGAIRVDGVINTGSGVSATASLQFGTGSFVGNGNGALQTPSSTTMKIVDSSFADAPRFQFGGTTASFPSIKRNGAGFDFRVADDSGYAATQSLYERFGSGSPESSVTAPVGAVYHRTDGGALTSFYVKESGSGNTGWVGK